MTISGRALCLRIELLAHAPRAITRMEIITTMNKKPFPVRPAGPYKPVRYLSVSAVLKGHHPEWLDEGSPGTLWDVSKHLPTFCRPNKADVDSNRAIEPNFLILQSPAAARFLGPQEPRKEVVVSDEERRIRSWLLCCERFPNNPPLLTAAVLLPLLIGKRSFFIWPWFDSVLR
jgi:hypothetical protein